MALGCYANWEELEVHFNSETSIFAQPHTELPPELLGFDSNFAFSESCVDPLWESDELLYSNNCHSLIPFVASPLENLYSPLPEIFSAHEYELYLYLKRQKLYEESFSSEIIPDLCDGFAVPSLSLFQEEPSPEILSPFPDFVSNPPVYSSKTVEAPKKPGTYVSLSAQSIAARQRRRKITQKTQELGKLIPGAQNMNTAEMFQTAHKYIKFLQAQVGILETMASFHRYSSQENRDSFDCQEIGRLLSSSSVQEKLSTADKCLVPKKFVESLGNHHKLQLDIDQPSDIKNLI